MPQGYVQPDGSIVVAMPDGVQVRSFEATGLLPELRLLVWHWMRSRNEPCPPKVEALGKWLAENGAT